MSYIDTFPFSAKAEQEIRARQAQRAGERGHALKYPAANELFLDIDSFEALGRFHAAVAQNKYLQSIYVSSETHTSPSGKAGRFHVVVKLNKVVDKFERITLQALLGSDLAREILSYQEAQAGCTTPTVFFEKEPMAVLQELSPDLPPPAPAAPTSGSDY